MAATEEPSSIDICRICHDSRDENAEELISPCDCQGSLKYVHASCMDRWRIMNMDNHNRMRCQLCQSYFRLVGTGRLAQNSFFKAILSHKRLYRWAIRTISTLSLIPMSFGALFVSSMFRRDDVYLAGPADIQARPWKRQAFGVILSENILKEINLYIAGAPATHISRFALFIYGLAKLGSYGCTVWLFTDGMSGFFPVHITTATGERRPSPLMAVLKVVLEFYIFPLCLKTPETSFRLPLFVSSTAVGLLYVVARLEQKLRVLLLGILPYCKQLELGTLSRS